MGRNEKPQRSPGRQLRRKQGWMLWRYPQRRIRWRKRSGPEHKGLVELTDGWRWGARTPVIGVWGLDRNASLMKKGKYLSLNCTYKLNWSPFSRSSSCAGCVALKQRCIPPQEAEARLWKAAIRGTGRIDALLRELIEELRGAKDELQGLRGGPRTNSEVWGEISRSNGRTGHDRARRNWKRRKTKKKWSPIVVQVHPIVKNPYIIFGAGKLPTYFWAWKPW